MPRIMKFSEAVNEALREAMAADPRVICYGLGVSDPKGVFGTTLGLRERFGQDRVFDMPTSENGMTGVAIGAALTGLRPVMTHQRVDFFLLAMDQLVNAAAKWHYTFGGRASVPITIRLIIGRGWGQGPTHSQNLQAWFAHVPGLKVVAPATAHDAKGLLLSSIFDNNPVIFMEHRWLHNSESETPEGDYRVPIGKAALLRNGSDITIVGMSYMTVEALRAADHMSKHGIASDVVDLRTLSPLDWDAVFSSVRRTGRLLALDTGWGTCSISSEVAARTAMELWDSLKSAPQRLALPDFPVPAGFSLTKKFFPGAEDIVLKVEKMLSRKLDAGDLRTGEQRPHDVPAEWFKGPF